MAYVVATQPNQGGRHSPFDGTEAPEPNYPAYVSNTNHYSNTNHFSVADPGSLQYNDYPPAVITEMHRGAGARSALTRKEHAEFYQALHTQGPVYEDDYLKMKHYGKTPTWWRPGMPLPSGPAVTNVERRFSLPGDPPRPYYEQRAGNYLPGDIYLSDGKVIRDKEGEILAHIKPRPGGRGFIITSPQGRDILLSDIAQHAVVNIDRQRNVPPTGDVLAIVDNAKGLVYTGDRSVPWPTPLFNFRRGEKGGRLLVEAFDRVPNANPAPGKDPFEDFELASFSRPLDNGFPVDVRILPRVRHHLLLLALFAV